MGKIHVMPKQEKSKTQLDLEFRLSNIIDFSTKINEALELSGEKGLLMHLMISLTMLVEQANTPEFRKMVGAASFEPDHQCETKAAL